jgi:hypothetical protein
MSATTENKTGVLMVMTNTPADKIIVDGGLFMPRVNTDRVMQECAYLVCVDAERTAFLVGTITKVSASNANGQKMICIDNYAEIHKRNAWTQNGNRIGIAYYNTPTEAKLRFGNYDFEPINKAAHDHDSVAGSMADSVAGSMATTKELFAKSLDIDFEDKPAIGQMNMNEAKSIIAKALGLEPHQIEIVIKI